MQCFWQILNQPSLIQSTNSKLSYFNDNIKKHIIIMKYI